MNRNGLPMGVMLAEDYDRMLHKSFIDGIEVAPTLNPRIFLATSVSVPERKHRVTVAMCSCQGHQRFGYCKHRARLLFDLGPIVLNQWCGVRADGSLCDWNERLSLPAAA